MDEAENAPGVILLPALSSISTRAEMHPLLDRLAADFRVTTVYWPGFGNLARSRADWSPNALSAFLNWYLAEISPGSRMIVAAGVGFPRKTPRAEICQTSDAEYNEPASGG